MALRDLTPMDLCRMATVLASASRIRQWNTALPNHAGDTVEEIQCMRIAGCLYIAGNYDEAKAVGHFLNAFGVTDYNSLIDCLRYGHELLSVGTEGRRRIIGVASDARYSAQEQVTIDFTTGFTSVLTPLTETEIVRAVELRETENIGTLAGADKKLAWFLKKFKGGKPPKNAPIVARPPGTSVKEGASFDASREVMLITDNSNVHAELKLLRLAAKATIDRTLPATERSIAVGGLKRACKFCDPWIARYSRWIFLQYKVKVELPDPDTRTQGGGAGTRPKGVGEEKFGRYVKALFNGEDNNTGTDMVILARDEEW